MTVPPRVGCADWTTPAAVKALPPYADCVDALLTPAIKLASLVLFELTGEQWVGSYDYVVRPSSRSLRYDGPASLTLNAGYVWRRPGSWCTCHYDANRSDLGCGVYSIVGLPHYPVTSITSVIVNGTTLAGTAYTLLENSWLLRVDGFGWPCCQDITRPITEQGTWQLSYAAGEVPPDAAVLAANIYAGEVALGLAGNSACRLPKRVQTITRQGVSAVVFDPMQFIQDGKVGIPEVDVLIHAVNPEGLRHDAIVASPDIKQGIVRTNW